MEITQEKVDEFKEIYRKENGKELSDTEAREAAYNLQGFVELIWDISKREAQLKHRLKKEPDGFPVDSHYSCRVCSTSISPETGWYDRWGQKCKPCTKAVKDSTVPTFVCEHRDSFYSAWQIKDRLGIKNITGVKKLIKGGGGLKARTIMAENGTVHDYIFLKKENPELIDPDRHSPSRKSYDRHKDKVSKIWTREEAKKMKEEFRKKFKKTTPILRPLI